MQNARLFLFLALGFVLLLIWQQWQQDYGQPPAAVSDQPQTTAPSSEVPAPEGASADESAIAAPAEPQVAGKLIHVRTDLLDVTIDTRGGEVVQARLPQLSVSVKDETPVTLLDRTNALYFVARSGLVAKDHAAPGADAVFQAEAEEFRLDPDSNSLVVPLTWESGNGIKIVKRFIFERNRYVVRVEQEVINASAAPWRGYPYLQLRRDKAETEGGFFGARSYTGGVWSTPDDRYRKLDFEDIAEGKLARNVSGGWLAFIQHYFLAAWIPPADGDFAFKASSANSHYLLTAAAASYSTVAPGTSGSFESTLYVGPKEPNRLEGVAPDLELTVDYGMLTIISKPLFWLLEKIHDLVGNWGWAIVLLTLLIKIAFFKLSEASYRSMARMRKLQPKMMQLKERHKDDRQKLNQELMDLYKKEKINPLGGCLPIVIQIPVFIALYWVLLESVDLRHADFILWINDLSSRDPYFVLPIIMGVSMLIQQRLNPAPMDPVQQKVMMALPVVFTFFFLFFPAGLVLYWVTNNVLSIAQQWFITRRIERGETA